jgi:hypothetical protein
MEDLLGLHSAKRAVKALLASDRAHAVLFFGMPGSGKTTLAEHLAQGWMCTAETSRPCGECRTCHAFGRASAADLLKIEPQLPSNAIRLEAVSPNRTGGADAPVSLQEFLRSGPLAARHKVVILQDADRMTPAAANALLKTLEEPEPYAKLILTTSSVGRVLPTILSRCLAIACELPRPEESDAPDDVLRWAEGAPGRVATIRKAEEVYRSLETFAADLGHRPPAAALVASEEFRVLCDLLAKRLELGARQAQAEGLAALGSALARAGAAPGDIAAVAEAHRRILGNAAPGSTFDALFSRVLLSRPR